MVRSIGADHVINYPHNDVTRTGQRSGLILDVAGNRSLNGPHLVSRCGPGLDSKTGLHRLVAEMDEAPNKEAAHDSRWISSVGRDR